MTIGKLKREIGIWQFSFTIASHSPVQFGFHPFISIWIVNFRSFPDAGAMIEPKQYDGFHRTFTFPIPYVAQWYRTKMIATLIGWDKRPMPKWIPQWVLMRKCMKPSNQRVGEFITSEPRPGLIKFLTKQFMLPTKIKF